MKDLQEMNLVDDFLVNSLTSHKIYEEAGELFDVEPDQNDSRAEKESLPRRVRFYHAKIDAPRELRELLRYMEDSTEENARSEGLKALHRMVTEVKRDGEVGFAYMKSFEREQRVREEGRTEGLNEGKRTAAINLKAMNMPVEQIAKVLEEDVKVVEEWLSEA